MTWGKLKTLVNARIMDDDEIYLIEYLGVVYLPVFDKDSVSKTESDPLIEGLQS